MRCPAPIVASAHDSLSDEARRFFFFLPRLCFLPFDLWLFLPPSPFPLRSFLLRLRRAFRLRLRRLSSSWELPLLLRLLPLRLLLLGLLPLALRSLPLCSLQLRLRLPDSPSPPLALLSLRSLEQRSLPLGILALRSLQASAPLAGSLELDALRPPSPLARLPRPRVLALPSLWLRFVLPSAFSAPWLLSPSLLLLLRRTRRGDNGASISATSFARAAWRFASNTCRKRSSSSFRRHSSSSLRLRSASSTRWLARSSSFMRRRSRRSKASFFWRASLCKRSASRYCRRQRFDSVSRAAMAFPSTTSISLLLRSASNVARRQLTASTSAALIAATSASRILGS
mmetsp:Transcript_84206/g.234870  ORF Transcript_84206/g.234870 Transcript_84206/m.234870 type:complete len:342 (+) Transcript_84206:73-1098(+)